MSKKEPKNQAPAEAVEEMKEETAETAKEAAEPPKEPTAEEKLQAELAEQKDQYQRVLAEYANYKRRTEQEKEAIGKFAKADVLGELLPLLDNLDRAAASPDGPEYRKGIEMIVRQLHETLKKVGVTEINPLGEPFDSDIHSAVMREDAAEGVEPDTVTAVFQTGYKLGDKLIRPAMVKVAT